MRTYGTLVLLVLAACATTGFSQAKVLGLEEAKQIALERNLSVVQAQNYVQSAQSQVLAAYGSYLPTLSASAGWTRNQSESPVAIQTAIVQGIPFTAATGGITAQNSFSTGASLNYTLFDGFRREGNFGAAKSNAQSVQDQAVRMRQTIVYQTESSYLNVLRNTQLMKVNEENLKRDNKQLERIQESNRVGASAPADVYRQQSQVAVDELALIQAQSTLDKSRADLAAFIGLDATADYEIADSSISLQISKEELDSTALKYSTIGELSKRALAARPDYLSASEQLAASESGVSAARAGYFPSVSAFAGYGFYHNELTGLTQYKNMNWGISIRWNIFDAFQTNQSLQGAVATQRNAEISLAQTAITVNVDVKKAMLDLDAARKQYEVSLTGLHSATEDQKISQERYNLGAGTLLDLLVASANLVNAQANQVNAVYNYVISKRNVEYVLGERQY
jgi:outer membrane protein